MADSMNPLQGALGGMNPLQSAISRMLLASRGNLPQAQGVSSRMMGMPTAPAPQRDVGGGGLGGLGALGSMMKPPGPAPMATPGTLPLPQLPFQIPSWIPQ